MDFIYFIYDTKFYKSKELIELLKEIVFNDLFAYLFFITIHSLSYLFKNIFNHFSFKF